MPLDSTTSDKHSAAQHSTRSRTFSASTALRHLMQWLLQLYAFMLATPAAAYSSQVAWLVSSLSRADDTAAASVGSTRMPFLSVCMMSTGPPLVVATMGTPCAAASISVRPNGSCSAAWRGGGRVSAGRQGGVGWQGVSTCAALLASAAAHDSDRQPGTAARAAARQPGQGTLPCAPAVRC